jgi:class 3 adenylate cyclase
MTEPTRKLAAILAADVVGYSRLIAEDEARTLDALRALRRESFEPLVAEHRGEVVKRIGPVPILFRSLSSDIIDEGDKEWHQGTATISGLMRFALLRQAG